MVGKRKESLAEIGRKTSPLAYEALLAPIRKEIDLAYLRLDENPAKKLRWLLEFSNRDLGQMGQGELFNLGWELVMFAVGSSPDMIVQSDDARNSFYTLFGSRWLEKITKTKTAKEWEPLIESNDKEDKSVSVNQPMISEFHDEMKRVFDLLFAKKIWETTPPARSETIGLTNLGVTRPINMTPLKPMELLKLRAVELIRNEEERLNLCGNPRCQRRFVAAKKGRAKYCSPRCSAYVRIAKSRGKDVHANNG